MIVKLTCSYAGEIRQIFCVSSFPVDWLTQKLGIAFGMNPLTIKYTLEGSFVHGGVISDYVRGKQQTAYVEVYLNTSYIQRIKCFVKYGKYLRVVNASPQSTLFDIVTKAFSDSFTICVDPLVHGCIIKVDGEKVDGMRNAMDIIRFGSLIEVFEGESVLRVPAPIETSPTIDIHFVFAKNVHHVYSICPTDGTHILEDLTQYCSIYLDVNSSFIHLYDTMKNMITAEYILNSSNPTVIVKVEMQIKDSLGKIHSYSPSFMDTVAMIVTDVQNCPFLRLPMKLTKEGVDCDQDTPIWNLLSDVSDTLVFRVTERVEDIECLLLAEDYTITIDTKIFGMKSISIPEDALLCVEPEESPDKYTLLVEYNGYHHIEVPKELCKPVPEVDYVTYESPVIKRACIEWDSNCPYQLPVHCNQQYSILRESEEYYYGHELHDETKQGWIMKSLLV